MKHFNKLPCLDSPPAVDPFASESLGTGTCHGVPGANVVLERPRHAQAQKSQQGMRSLQEEEGSMCVVRLEGGLGLTRHAGDADPPSGKTCMNCTLNRVDITKFPKVRPASDNPLYCTPWPSSFIIGDQQVVWRLHGRDVNLKKR
ncbi:hypothetical protein BD626DRAFT_2615 [Schizophyllum amplum]|uniref:Uncharacterized protein n=1 Tax=Schizophyllum amplum TaxID=97359 RepID=A0A550CVU3_9AGAR|nr:hypothetical protein BD626DRAFT_2615 [Auriculariopsis ampla]